MPSELRDPTDPRDWLRRARSSMALAKAGQPTPEVLFEDLAFHAQQAAEKAIKAVELAVRVMRWAQESIAGEWETPA